MQIDKYYLINLFFSGFLKTRVKMEEEKDEDEVKRAVTYREIVIIIIQCSTVRCID